MAARPHKGVKMVEDQEVVEESVEDAPNEVSIEGDNENQENDTAPSGDQGEEEITKTNELEDKSNNLSDEELDAVADTAISVLQDILKYFDIGEVTIDEYEGEEGELILDITGDDLAVLIGRHGKTLDSLQFIVSAITVRKIGFRYPVIVDVEGYKNRQRQKLESIAQSAANRAVNQTKNIKLRPMTPYERRIIHITLRNDSRVETVSEGEGSGRYVVVIPQ